MATTLPLRRPTLLPNASITHLPPIPHSQTRHASLLRRPKRPYTFTQLVTLSDGSSFTHRTTSPLPVYKSSKDTRNAPLWNPSSQKLMNVEADEAGRLRAFRMRFGRGWDAEGTDVGEEGEGEGEGGGDEGGGGGEGEGEGGWEEGEQGEGAAVMTLTFEVGLLQGMYGLAGLGGDRVLGWMGGGCRSVATR